MPHTIFEHQLYQFIHNHLHPSWINPIMWFLTCLGLGWAQVLIIIAARFVIPKIGKLLLFPGLAAFAVSGIATQILKKVFGGPRPWHFYPEWTVADELLKESAFPSGHTMSSFAIASVVFIICKRTGKPGWGLLVLFLALLVGISRVYRGVHWPIDVVGGAFFGIVSGLLVMLVFDYITKKRSGSVQAEPSIE